MLKFFFVIFSFFIVALKGEENITKRYEYKFSFKGPILTQADGSVPFFELGGSTMASPDYVRLTPSMIDKKGYIFNKKMSDFGEFEAKFSFRVIGRGRVGADGLVFWYITDKTDVGGITMGGPSVWNGLGLIFDTYDNDGGQNNPVVQSIINDGTHPYTPDNDGEFVYSGRCMQDFRNRPYPINVNVTYWKQTLKVTMTQGLTPTGTDIMNCLEVKDVVLPASGYFGFTAATGGLADDHDVVRLEISSLKETSSQVNAVNEEDRIKFEKEFQQYAESLKIAKEEYDKKHEDRKQKYKETEEESIMSRNLRQIWEGQVRLQQTMMDLHAKLDHVGLQADRGQMRDAPSSNVELKVNNIIQALDQLTHNVNQLASKKDADPFSFNEFSNHMKNDIRGLTEITHNLESKLSDLAAASSQNSCPSCLSSTLFVVGLMAHVCLVVGYLVYQNSQSNAAKKFY